MHYIKEEHWEAFRGGDKNKGKKFENLVAKLLSAMDYRTWTPTGGSGDGCKDFVRLSTKEGAWAECKIHGRPVSFRTFSPTLVMAILYDVPEILFFSYTRATSQAMIYLSRFAIEMRKIVRLYDDIILENLIFTYWNQVNHFFPKIDSFRMFPSLPPLVTSRISIDNDIDIIQNSANEVVFKDTPSPPDYPIYWNEEAESNEIEKEIEYKLKVRQMFSLDIFIRNLDHINTLALELHVQQPKNGDAIHITSYEILETGYKLIRFLPGELKSYRLQLNPLIPGKVVALPKIFIKTNNFGIIDIKTPKITIRPAVSPGLIGSKHLSVLSEYKEKAIISRRRNLTASIYGRSGTGKSRLIEEIRNEHLRYNHRVISFNSELGSDNTLKTFIQKLVSWLYQLPIIKLDKNVENNSPDDEIIEKILYQKNFSVKKHLSSCIGVILKKSYERLTVLIIDNVQNLDPDSIDFLRQLVIALSNTFSPTEGLRVILSVNTDLALPGSLARGLNNEIILWARDKSNYFLAFELQDLEESDVVALLSETLTLPNDESSTDYSQYCPLLIKRLSKNRSKRPLFIIEFIYFLIDLEVLRYWYDKIDVNSPELLFQYIRSEPQSLYILLERRWEFIMKKSKFSQNELNYTLILASLMGSISIQHFAIFKLQSEIVDYLEDVGILKRERGRMLFFHNDLFRHFEAKAWKINVDNAQRLSNCIKTNNLISEYNISLFICQYISGELSPKVLSGYLDSLINEKILPGGYHYQRFLDHLLESITLKSFIDIPDIVRGVTKVCEDKKRYANFHDGLLAYHKAYSLIHNHPPLDFLNSYQIIFFYIEYANAYFALHQEEKALPILTEGLEKLGNLVFPNHFLKMLAKGHLLNRMSVSLKYINNQYDKSVSYAKEAMNIGLEIKDKELIFSGTVDYGHALKECAKNKKEVINLWTKAINLLENEDIFIYPKHIAGIWGFIKAKLLLLESKYQLLFEFIEDQIEHCDFVKDHYNIVNLLLTKSIGKFFQSPFDPDENNYILDRAEDRCNSQNIPRFTWVISHLRGKLWRRCGEIKKAARFYSLAIERLTKVKKTPIDAPLDKKNELFYRDLAIFFRKNKNCIDIDKYISFVRRDVKLYIKKIWDENEANFLNFCNTIKPLSIFHLNGEDFPSL